MGLDLEHRVAGASWSLYQQSLGKGVVTHCWSRQFIVGPQTLYISSNIKYYLFLSTFLFSTLTSGSQSRK